MPICRSSKHSFAALTLGLKRSLGEMKTGSIWGGGVRVYNRRKKLGGAGKPMAPICRGEVLTEERKKRDSPGQRDPTYAILSGHLVVEVEVVEGG